MKYALSRRLQRFYTFHAGQVNCRLKTVASFEFKARPEQYRERSRAG
jgi:hypothetical protein